MSSKTLMILALGLAVLVGVVLLRQDGGAPTGPSAIQPGDLLFEDLDINQAARLEVAGPAATCIVERVEGSWVVSSLHGYPANFSTLVDTLRLLPELEVGQVVRDGETMLQEFSLLESRDDQRLPVDVKLFDQQGSILAHLALGTERYAQRNAIPGAGGFAQGRYIRKGEGPVILVDGNLSEFTADAIRWIDPSIVQIPQDEITAITLTAGWDTFKLNVEEDGTFDIDGLPGAQETDQEQVRRLLRPLQSLSCTDIVDPEKADVIFDEETALRSWVSTKEGVEYAILISTNRPDPNYRYVRVEVSHAGSDETTEEARKKAEEEKARLDGWTYIVAGYTGDALTPEKGTLIKHPSPETAP